MLTGEELSGSKTFLAARCYWNMRRPPDDMLGGPLDWFMAAFDIGTAIDGFRNEAEDRRQFAHIDSSLNNIRNQLTQIQTELTNLAALINKSTWGFLRRCMISGQQEMP